MALPTKGHLIDLTTTTQQFRDALALLYDYVAGLPAAGTSYTTGEADARFLGINSGGDVKAHLGIVTDGARLKLIDTDAPVNAARVIIRQNAGVFEVLAVNDAGVSQGPVVKFTRNASGQGIDLTFTHTGTDAAIVEAAGTVMASALAVVTKEKADANYAPYPSTVPLTVTTRTLTETDIGRTIIVRTPDPATITIPTAAEEDMTRNAVGRIFREGAGTVTLVAPAGVLLNAVDGGTYVISNQYESLIYYKKTDTSWIAGKG